MKILSSLILILTIQFSYAQDKVLENKERIIASIQETAAKTETIQSDFIQTKRLNYLKEPVISSGKFYSKGENMRWEQQKPYTYIMLISDDGLQIKDEDKEKKYGGMAERFVDQIKKVLQTSIKADFENSTDLLPTYFETNKYYKVVLTPQSRQLKKMYQFIELSFDKSSFRLKLLTFVEEDGSSEMKFLNEQFNLPLKSSLFTNF